VYRENLPFLWKFTDLDKKSNQVILVALRLLQAILLTSQLINPDEYW